MLNFLKEQFEADLSNPESTMQAKYSPIFDSFVEMFVSLDFDRHSVVVYNVYKVPYVYSGKSEEKPSTKNLKFA